MSSDWIDTELWKLLDTKTGADDTKHYVRLWLDEVQMLLAKAGTAPLDFTLHDDDHSYRVAQRMVEIVPSNTLNNLSEYEVALLLLAAYLHDIGMNPRRSVVRQVRDFLTSGSSEALDPVELTEVRRWLDEFHPSVRIPLSTGSVSANSIHQAEFLTAHFCRHRHNDWSEKYIVEKAKEFRRHPYAAWIQDLTLLCKSHHFGFSSLMSPPFDLRLVGSVGKLVNLRYLAAVLRVADVLDFDPERTPDVIFSHRSPHFKSSIYWHKDHEISLSLEQGTWDIFFNARTDNAWTHAAILDTANAVDAELGMCAIIDRQNGFVRGKRLENVESYKWPWSPRLTRLIEPLPDTFVYIEGSFRPNSQRILSLLAGTKLYHTPFAAVRELVQNAFDAVREQISIELLQDPNPSDNAVLLARSKLHHVCLALEVRGSDLWIICQDTGTGMTRAIIERHLLVSGSSPRPELLELERDCKARGVYFQRSGEFGIGALSYFMVADKMIVETKAGGELTSGSEEAHGWKFEIDGPGTVGELRRATKYNRGTTIQLRVREDAKEKILSDDFKSYVRTFTAKVPCAFELRLSNERHSIEPGWVAKQEDWVEIILTKDFTNSRDRAIVDGEKWVPVREDARTKLRFLGPFQGALPDNQGHYRITLPYFHLQRGPSLAYLSEGDHEEIALLPQERPMLVPTARVIESWRGFPVPKKDEPYRNSIPSFVELDILDGAIVSVNRENLQFDRASLENFLDEKLGEIVQEFFALQAANCYSSITLALLRRPYRRGAHLKEISDALGDEHCRAWWGFWNRRHKPARLEWRKVRFPAVLGSDDPSSDYLLTSALQAGSIRDEVRSLDYHHDLHPLPGIFPQRLVIFDGPLPHVRAIYLDANEGRRSAARQVGPGFQVKFPPEWRHVAAVQSEDALLTNSDHELFKRVTDEIWAEFQERKDAVKSHGDLLNAIATEGRELAAAWLVYNLDEDEDFWRSMREEHRLAWAKVFELLSCPAVVKWDTQLYGASLMELRSDEIEITEGIVRPGEHALLPIPCDDIWWIREDRRKGKRRS